MDTATVRFSRLRVKVGRLTVTTVLTLALAGTTGWLGLRVHQTTTTQQDRSEAVAAARRLAVSLTTISASSSDRNVEQLLGATTGSLKDQIVQSSDNLRQVLSTNKVTSNGVAVHTGLVDLSPSQATVLVAVDAAVTAAKGSPQQRHYRMRASVTKVGDSWLVSDMEFVP